MIEIAIVCRGPATSACRSTGSHLECPVLAGSCLISTFLGGWKGTRTSWALEGHIRPIGGSHPIANREKALAYTYAPGDFGCAISPPLGYTYTVGDCTIDKKTAAKTCILNMQSEGSNKYYEATAVAKPY